jgi:hypothetical protein
VSLLLHGVVRANHPTAATRARVVTWQDLAAIVSESGAPTRENALSHLEMLSELVVAGPVVPVKFGTTTDSEDTVREEVLARSAPALRAHLERLDGLVEVHAYLRFDEEEALRAVFAESQDSWSAGSVDLSARIHLGERVAGLLVAWRRARVDELLAPVAAVARAQVSLPDREHTEERRAFLLPLKEIDMAKAVLAAAAAEYVGPLPAYNFLTEPATAPTATTSRWGW